jgi:predicted Zn-dependent protease
VSGARSEHGKNAGDLLALCTDALKAAGEPEAEAYATSKKRGFARFAIGSLGQHMEIDEPACVVRVAHGKRVAEASTSRMDQASIVAAIHEAAESARFAPETEAFPGFSDGKDAIADVPRFSDATANATAEERVERLASAMNAIRAAGLVSAGALETSVYSTAVATTRGCARSHDATVALFKTWALETPGAGGAAGYGGQLHRDVRVLDLAAETERAIRIAKASRDPIAIDAGSYDVVMEPAAVSELFEWLATIAFSASDVEQGTSPVAGRAGERITGESITITEDAVDPSDLGFGAPFDREGTARRRVPLIENGVAREVLFDRTYAARSTQAGGARSTGNATDSGIGATALHVEGGSAASVDELIAGMDRGLYVCRLHYVNGLLEPRRAVMTGLTRDGCFLVEKGKITRAVGNLRFTDSFLEGLARCDAMTKARTAIPTWWSDGGALVVPAVRMRGFTFNGKSQEKPKIDV